MALQTSSTVLNSLSALNKFSSAQEVYSHIQKSKKNIGLSTVYRTLQKLVEAQEVDFLRRPDGEGVYKVCAGSHHHHLLCANCGASAEFESEKFEKLLESISKEYGYTVQGHEAEIVGLCKKCSK
jgi:Fur family transcriptional regulator, ferric uptake regulator